MTIPNNIKKTAADIDHKVSYGIFSLGRKYHKTLRNYLKGLEWSCHGIPWLIGVTILIYTNRVHKFYARLLVGLIFDIVYVACAKAFFRRLRPSYAPQDDQMVMIGVDKMSFPSGHTSRAFYVALIMTDYPFATLFWIWAILVALSRVAYGRHFCGDILGGIIVGYFNWITQFSIFYPVNALMEYFIINLLAARADEDII